MNKKLNCQKKLNNDLLYIRVYIAKSDTLKSKKKFLADTCQITDIFNHLLQN